jgi:periplasmic protein TonB
MNALALHRTGETQQYAQSWAVSVVVHGLAVGLSILLVSDLRLVPQPEPFKWDVSVITPTPEPPQQMTPPLPPSTQPPAPAARPPAKPQPMKTVPVQAPAPVQSARPVQTAQRVVRTEVREIKPVVQSTSSVVPQPATQPIETVSRTAEPIETSRQTTAVAHAVPVMEPAPVEQNPTIRQNAPVEPALPVEQAVPVEHSTVVQTESPLKTEPQPIMKESAVISPSQPAPVTKQIVSEPAPVSSLETAMVSRAMNEVPHVATREMQEVTQPPAVVQERAAAKQAMSKPTGPAPMEQASIKELPVRSAPRTKADLSWLADALFSRVEQLKRYPPIARMNRWEGKVVLRAVIRDTGDVVDLEVTESSGHAILDRDALEVMKRASPLRLKHPLGRPQVEVHVPISYQLR